MSGRGGTWLGQVAWLAAESLRGFRRSRRVALAATFSIGLSCSVLFLFFYAWQAFGDWTRQQREVHGWVEVYLKDGSDLNTASSDVRSLAGIDGIQAVSAEQAREEFRREFGADMLDALDRNPLPASIRAHSLSAVRGDSAGLSSLKRQLEALPEAEEVRIPQSSLAQVERLQAWASRLALGTAVLLSLVLLGIVHNSISLSLGARGALIDNMRLCGASPWHMEIPFAAEGFLQGMFGGLIATVVPWTGLCMAARFFPLPLPLSWNWALTSGGCVVLFAALLGALSGWWTIRRAVR
jgi:cell division protein FtsX